MNQTFDANSHSICIQSVFWSFTLVFSWLQWHNTLLFKERIELSKFGQNFTDMYRYNWWFVSIQNLWPAFKNERFDLCIDTNTGVYRYIHQFLEILTDMYQIMQAWFDTSWCFWISERHKCVSIHASMIRYIGNYLPLRDHFCIDTSDRCIDTNCTKSVWNNFRTFVSIHMIYVSIHNT